MQRQDLKIWIVTFAAVLLWGALLLFIDIPALDGRYLYSVAEARELFQSLGPEGRLHYSQINYLDLLFITTYAYAIALWLKRLASRGGKTQTPLALMLLALTPALLDLGETLLILSCNLSSVWENEAVLLCLSYLTPSKWTAMLLTATAFYLARKEKRSA